LNLAGSRVLMHGDTFAVFNRFGDITRSGVGEQGVYHEGTRFLSEMRLRLGEHDLLLLSSAVLKNNLLLEVDLTNREIHENGVSIPQGFATTNPNSFDITTLSGLKLYRLRQSLDTNFGTLAASTPYQPRYIQFGLKLYF